MIHIEQCGFLTTIQDKGRSGYLQFGVSKSGVMDPYAAIIANTLVGNNETAAVMEITQSPHRFRFVKDGLIAFAGGGLQPLANNQIISLCQPVFIKEGTVVELKEQIPGFRLYLAVAGGFKADCFLNSSSTDLKVKAGGFHGRALKRGDILETNAHMTAHQKKLSAILQTGATLKFDLTTTNLHSKLIRVVRGIEWDYLTEQAKQTISSSSFHISQQSNRMGYRLKGDLLQTSQSCDITSSPVTKGTVQLTASGELIVLMVDAQTVGGYPRVMQVIDADLQLLAQKKPGDVIQFEMVSLQQAEEYYLKQAVDLKNLQKRIWQLYDN